jgi:hypothetical protein
LIVDRCGGFAGDPLRRFSEAGNPPRIRDESDIAFSVSSTSKCDNICETPAGRLLQAGWQRCGYPPKARVKKSTDLVGWTRRPRNAGLGTASWRAGDGSEPSARRVHERLRHLRGGTSMVGAQPMLQEVHVRRSLARCTALQSRDGQDNSLEHSNLCEAHTRRDPHC